MQSVSTKTGDKGTTGLANGARLPKDDLIFEVLGTQDELNSWLGLVIAKLSDYFVDHKKYLLQIQDTLFYIGAELAKSPKVSFSEKSLTELEQRSDSLQKKMEKNWVTKFLYPGGNEAAAVTDIARAVSRRFERVVVKYAGTTEVNPLIIKYVNRLSDYPFVLRCFISHQEHHSENIFESGSYGERLKKNLSKKITP